MRVSSDIDMLHLCLHPALVGISTEEKKKGEKFTFLAGKKSGPETKRERVEAV